VWFWCGCIRQDLVARQFRADGANNHLRDFEDVDHLVEALRRGWWVSDDGERDQDGARCENSAKTMLRRGRRMRYE